MATLAEDTTSWKASSVQRRDFRATADGPESPRKSGNRKNTRRWCKGVEGREHVSDIRMSNHGKMLESFGSGESCSMWNDGGSWHCSHERACMVCGKVLDWTLGDKCPIKPA